MISTKKDTFFQLIARTTNGLAILIDPDKFDVSQTSTFLASIPSETSILLVGGSTCNGEDTKNVVVHLKSHTNLPVILFPGSHEQLCHAADAVLFLNLVSGRNPQYLIEEQIKAVPFLEAANLEVISTGYLLIDGGTETSVQKVSETKAISPNDIELTINTAMACEYMGKKLIYLEAGSGAKNPVPEEVIKSVTQKVSIPVIVGGGIRSKDQLQRAYKAGASWVVMGTFFEK